MSTLASCTLCLLAARPAAAATPDELDDLVRVGKYREAAEGAAALGAEARAKGDQRLLVRARLARADALYPLGDVKGYLELSREALALATSLGDDYATGRALYNLSFEHYRSGTAKMLELLQRALPYTERAGDWRLQLRVQTALGMAYAGSGPYSEAIARFTKAGQLAAAGGDQLGVATSASNVAVMQEALGELDLAAAAFVRAIAVFRQLGAKVHLGRQLGNLGQIYAAQGETERAAALFDEALALQREAGEKQSQVVLLGHVSRVYWELGEDARGLRAAEESLALAREVGDRKNELVTLIDTSDRLLARGRLAEAAAIADEAFERQAALGDPALHVEARVSRARTRPDGEGALADAELACAEAAALGDPFILGRAQATRAELLERRGRSADAIAAWEAAIAARLQARARQEVHLWHARAARLRAAAGDDAGARRDWEAALALIEKEDQGIALDRFRIGLFRESAQVHRAYAAWLARRGEVARAWEVAEQGRARALARRVSGAAPHTSLTEREREALSRLSELQLQLADRATASAGRATLLQQIDDAELAYETARLAGLEQRHGAGGALPALSLQPPDGAVLIEYLVSGDELLVFSAGGAGPAVRFVPHAAEVLEQARRFSERAADPAAPFALTAQDRALAAALLGPEASQPGRARLVVVPDDVLHRLPFAALPGPQGDFLARTTAVSLAPSLLALGRQHEPRASGGGRAAAISAGASRSGLAPLAYAGAEAEMVARHARTSDLLLEATETAVRALDLSQYDVVHFASHSLFNDARPDRSAIVLGADAREDGLLQARELYRLPLRARLVVLSSCESGLGALVGGEGMVGLVHALLSAGSSAVLAALWRIPDAGAAEFMTRFYDHASGDGVTAAQALQRAQREAAEAGAHPAAWAGYAVFGDADQPLPLRRPARPLLWLPGLGALVVLALAALALRRRRA